MPLREHLQGVWDRTGEMPARLADAPQCPPALAYLWSIYVRLRRRCAPSMGKARVLFTDMLAFQQVTGTRLAPWEANVIERLDDAMLEAS